MFSTLTDRELFYLSTVVYERVYQTDEPIFHQNDRGFGMFLIAKGTVVIKTQPSSGDVMVTKLEEGSFFGELSLVDDENTRSASAVALEKTLLIGLFKPDLMDILERKPAMGVKILFQLSFILGKRLLRSTDTITRLTLDGSATFGTPSHDAVVQKLDPKKKKFEDVI